jgi:hypothetical protein
VKRNGTWETNQRKAQEEAERLALRRQLRAELHAELRPEIRRQLTQEFIQSGLVRITGPHHVNALVAGRNEWRGNTLLNELVPLVIDSDRFLRIDGSSVGRRSIRCLRDRLRSKSMS